MLKKILSPIKLIAIGLICFFIGAIWYPADMSGWSIDSDQKTIFIKSSWYKKYGQGLIGSDYYKGIVQWDMVVQYPNNVKRGSTVSISAIPKVLTIKPPEFKKKMFEKGQSKDTEVYVFDSEHVRQDLLNEFQNGTIKATLGFPAGVVSPKTLDKFDFENPSIWSVYMPNTGNHTAGIHIKIEPDSLFSIENKSDFEIAITVYEPLFSGKNIFSFICLILVPICCIPGLLSGLKEMKQHREK